LEVQPFSEPKYKMVTQSRCQNLPYMLVVSMWARAVTVVIELSIIRQKFSQHPPTPANLQATVHVILGTSLSENKVEITLVI